MSVKREEKRNARQEETGVREDKKGDQERERASAAALAC